MSGELTWNGPAYNTNVRSILEYCSIIPRPGGGLSHLRHGGGAKMTPRLTRKLGKLEGRAIRRSTALSEPIQSHFGHFSLR